MACQKKPCVQLSVERKVNPVSEFAMMMLLLYVLPFL